MKNVFIYITVIFTNLVIGQVGINNSNPTSTLDVVGDVKIEGEMFLETPGENLTIRNSKLLVKSSRNDVVQYDINISKFGPLNFADFIFENVSPSGLQDYDTKISINEYSITIQGFYFAESSTDSPEVLLQSNSDVDNVEGYQVYAYKNTTTNTWFVRGFANDSEFKNVNLSGYPSTNIDLHMNLIIYRANFITKTHADVDVNMRNSESKIALLPAGF